MLPSERKSVLAIALIAMLRMFGLFALLPVLAVYAAGLQGATDVLIGLAVGGYGLTQAALQIPAGALSDRIGRRPVIWLGLAIFAAGSIVAGISDSIFGVVAGRLLQGAGAVSATLAALLADVTRPEIRTRSMAFFGIGIGLAFLLALILGPMIAAIAGVRPLFWVAAACAVVAALLLLLLPGNGSSSSSDRRALSSAITAPLLRLDLYVFVLHTILTAMFVALPFVLRDELHFELADHWKLYVGALAVSLLGTVPLILGDERRGKAALLSIALALLVTGLLIMSWRASSVLQIFTGLAVFFAGFNFLEAALPSRLSLLAAESSRGAAMGVFSSSQFLGAFAGGVLGGMLLDDAPRLFAVCSAIAALWLAGHVLHRPAA